MEQKFFKVRCEQFVVFLFTNRKCVFKNKLKVLVFIKVLTISKNVHNRHI